EGEHSLHDPSTSRARARWLPPLPVGWPGKITVTIHPVTEGERAPRRIHAELSTGVAMRGSNRQGSAGVHQGRKGGRLFASTALPRGLSLPPVPFLWGPLPFPLPQRERGLPC